MIRENSYKESMKFVKSLNEAAAKREAERIQEKVDKIEAWKKQYNSIITDRVQRERFHGRLLESCRDDSLSSAIKAIYITSLENYCGLTDDETALAETLVDNWIKESGGAGAILSTKNQHKSYLVARIAEIVENAAQRAVKEVESIAEADDDSEKDDENSKQKVSDENDTKKEDSKESKDSDTKDKDETDKTSDKDAEEKKSDKSKDEHPVDDDEEGSTEDDVDPGDFPDEDLDKDTDNDDIEDDEEEEEEPEDFSSEIGIDDEDDDEEDSDESVDYDDIEDDEEEEEVSDDESEEAGDEILDDDPNEDEDDSDVDDAESNSDDPSDDDDEVYETDDNDQDNDGCDDECDSVDSDEMYKELEDEADVKKAINTIQTRVADAEEKFIKKNAEDKKKVDELLHKINNSVKTVEEIDDDDNLKSQAEQEHVIMYKRQINDLANKAPKSVFEAMANEIGRYTYLAESTKAKVEGVTEEVDTSMDGIIGKTRILYGFLETLNTLRLEDVNKDYIKKVIEEIN